ncbi:MAG: hypothetical protein ACRDT4_16310 [Micromonosporaceae bacterium]
MSFVVRAGLATLGGVLLWLWWDAAAYAAEGDPARHADRVVDRTAATAAAVEPIRDQASSDGLRPATDAVPDSPVVRDVAAELDRLGGRVEVAVSSAVPPAGSGVLSESGSSLRASAVPVSVRDDTADPPAGPGSCDAALASYRLAGASRQLPLPRLPDLPASAVFAAATPSGSWQLPDGVLAKGTFLTADGGYAYQSRYVDRVRGSPAQPPVSPD